MKALTAEQRQELDAKHGEVAVVTSSRLGKDGDPTWQVAFRKPTRPEYKQYRSRNHNPAQTADAQEILARQCVVHPDPAAFVALLDEWPAIPEAATGAFLHLMGVAVDEDSK